MAIYVRYLRFFTYTNDSITFHELYVLESKARVSMHKLTVLFF